MLLKASKKYGDKAVLDNLELDIPRGEITCILGVSGAGKTTILNIVGGNLEYDGSLTDKPESVSYVFQTDRLIPQLSVYQNLQYVLKKSYGDEETRGRVLAMLEKVGLSDEVNTRCNKLSGGMAQRVALARAFLYPADVLLMDEPFKELDVALKKRMTDLFLELWRAEQRTVLYVTHDVDEALMLADNVNILESGHIVSTIKLPQGIKDLSSQTLIDARNKIYSHFFAERG